MAKIADISTKLSLNNRDFKKGLQSTSKSLAKFHAAFKRAAGRIAKAGVVALVAAGAAMVAIVKKTSDKIDKLSKEARKLDITTEMLAGLGHAAKLSGLDQEKLSKSLVKMTKAVSEANEGLSTQVRAFDDLGLEVGDLMKMDAGQQFLAIADAFGDIENHSTKVRVAMDIFGRTGGDLLVTMEQGAEGIRKAIEEAKRLGITFSEEQGAMVEEANDSMTKLASIGEGAFNQLTIGVAPFISLWADAMTEAALEGESMTDRVSAGIEKIVKVIGVLGNAVNLVKGTIQFAFGGIQLVIFGTLKGINESLIWTFGKLDKLLRGFQKVPGAKKLGIPAGLNPDLTHEQVMDAMRGASSTEYIAQGMFDARANIAAGKKALVAGAMGFSSENLLADYHETLRKAAERAAKIKEEHKAKKALRDANAAAEKAIAEATAAAAKAAAEDAAAAAEVAKAAKGKAAGAGLRLVDEVAQVIIEDIKQANVEGAKVAEQARRHIGDWRLGRKAKIGGFELDAPWDDPRGRWGQMVRAAEADAGAGADGGLNDPGQIKRDLVQVQQGKVLLQILTSLNNIRDSKFVSFAS
jgi:hypothetical protein